MKYTPGQLGFSDQIDEVLAHVVKERIVRQNGRNVHPFEIVANHREPRAFGADMLFVRADLELVEANDDVGSVDVVFLPKVLVAFFNGGVAHYGDGGAGVFFKQSRGGEVLLTRRDDSISLLAFSHDFRHGKKLMGANVVVEPQEFIQKIAFV